MVETTIKPRNAAAGQPVVFDVTLHNKSTTNPCYINAGWSNLQVNVTSGSAQVASLAAWLHAHPERVAVGVDLNVTHLRAVASGRVTGRAVPVRLGNGTLVHTVDVHDDEGRLTATGRLTSQLVAPKK